MKQTQDDVLKQAYLKHSRNADILAGRDTRSSQNTCRYEPAIPYRG